MRARRKSKIDAGQSKHSSTPQRLDNTQLNEAMRYVFAWMWVGMGITATVASALPGNLVPLDLATFVIIILAHLTIAFTLDRKLHHFSPIQAGAFFIFYAVLTGATLSVAFSILALIFPSFNDALVIACFSTACLFGLMTLIGWQTRLDLSRGRSYLLMLLLGLLIAFLTIRLQADAPFEYIFSFFSIIYFSALTACHWEPAAVLSADPDLKIEPTDSLRFGLLAALKLYLSANNIFVLALFSSLSRRSAYSHHYHHLPHHQQNHYSGIGSGSIGSGSIGSGSIGGGSGSVGGGGGGSIGGGSGSFTP